MCQAFLSNKGMLLSVGMFWFFILKKHLLSRADKHLNTRYWILNLKDACFVGIKFNEMLFDMNILHVYQNLYYPSTDIFLQFSY